MEEIWQSIRSSAASAGLRLLGAVAILVIGLKMVSFLCKQIGKGKGFGKAQLSEAVRRIKEYNGLKEIRVWTNSNLVAPKNYESVGFVLYDRKENNDEAAFSGDYLYYRIQLL